VSLGGDGAGDGDAEKVKDGGEYDTQEDGELIPENSPIVEIE
jgi:hypothetical protein